MVVRTATKDGISEKPELLGMNGATLAFVLDACGNPTITTTPRSVTIKQGATEVLYEAPTNVMTTFQRRVHLQQHIPSL